VALRASLETLGRLVRLALLGYRVCQEILALLVTQARRDLKEKLEDKESGV